MSRSRTLAAVRALALALLTATAAACGDDSPSEPPALTTLRITLPDSALAMGQTTTATVAGLDQDSAPIATGAVTWASSAETVASVTPAGVVTAVAAGSAEIIATAGATTARRTVKVAAPAPIRINEVESNGGSPGDWAELINPTGAAVDVSGWIFRDNDPTHTYRLPAGTSIPAGGYLVLEEAAFGFGLGGAEDARLFNPFEVPVDSYTWTAHAPVTYARCPNGSGPFAASATSTKGTANDCRPLVKINEVESSGGTPGDWIELYNAGATVVSLGGFVLRDNDDTHTYTLAAGTTLAPGAFLVVEEAALGFGLGAGDAARLFDAAGALIDGFEWTAHAAVTYGRCPDGAGIAVATTAATKGTANNCTPAGPVTSPWPGSNEVETVDGTAVFGGNLSGLTYEGAAGGRPAYLWAVRNGPGTLYRMVASGGNWIPDPADGWGSGKALRYPDGLGNPDAEGVTFAGGGSAGGIYVATERNNDASTISRNVVLRFDPAQAGTTLRATHAWDLTADLPVVGANLGIEAVSWIPDADLVARGFFDEAKGRAYAPADYADHGTGIFFVGVEANGIIYAYALNHATGAATRIATIATGFPGVMGLEYDATNGALWATCDDGCGNTAGILEIDTASGSAGRGRFLAPRRFARPTGLPNLNNEGFAFAPVLECSGGLRPVFWADDGETGGHSIRRGYLPCGRVAVSTIRAR
ncbi:lamin tail domain-containing protein [Longimicrobium terrae]|uniref:LTD domain-containing protein n=1 Tax=Longimicrobium terrae TaxID=1639882 RepID=A0A841GVC8_9BACT|nr:hypothetical protein [Longimicrobium terrae]MBB6069618.1 hypothetical protein [Longimicrobium terrae]NNC31581.1 hypothetical protein [Longimicrobium terrae]